MTAPETPAPEGATRAAETMMCCPRCKGAGIVPMAPPCWCTHEAGDSPCPLHGMDEAAPETPELRTEGATTPGPGGLYDPSPDRRKGWGAACARCWHVHTFPNDTCSECRTDDRGCGPRGGQANITVRPGDVLDAVKTYGLACRKVMTGSGTESDTQTALDAVRRLIASPASAPRETRDALLDAAKSLEWIANRYVEDSEDDGEVFQEVRSFAYSRASVAREAAAEATRSAPPEAPASAPSPRSCLWHADCDAADRALRPGVAPSHPPYPLEKP